MDIRMDGQRKNRMCVYHYWCMATVTTLYVTFKNQLLRYPGKILLNLSRKNHSQGTQPTKSPDKDLLT